MKAGTSTTLRLRPGLAIAGSGLAAGLVSSLAISGLLLLVERISELPVGTFYLVLVSMLLKTQEYTAGAAILGFLMHLAAGSVIGFAISIPFIASKRLARYAPAYGLAVGFVLWASLFLPITYWVMIPLLNSLDSQEAIRQQVPAGRVYAVATSDLLAMLDRVIVGSVAFNVFYGLLVVMLARSMYASSMRRNRIISSNTRASAT